jgi:hypothetical protein
MPQAALGSSAALAAFRPGWCCFHPERQGCADDEEDVLGR